MAAGQDGESERGTEGYNYDGHVKKGPAFNELAELWGSACVLHIARIAVTFALRTNLTNTSEVRRVERRKFMVKRMLSSGRFVRFGMTSASDRPALLSIPLRCIVGRPISRGTCPCNIRSNTGRVYLPALQSVRRRTGICGYEAVVRVRARRSCGPPDLSVGQLDASNSVAPFELAHYGRLIDGWLSGHALEDRFAVPCCF